MAGKKPDYNVYVTREGGDGKNHYRQIGVAWCVANGGISLKLDALPTNGEAVMFPPREEDAR
jgi:hypothetical protein